MVLAVEVWGWCLPFEPACPPTPIPMKTTFHPVLCQSARIESLPGFLVTSIQQKMSHTMHEFDTRAFLFHFGLEISGGPSFSGWTGLDPPPHITLLFLTHCGGTMK